MHNRAEIDLAALRHNYRQLRSYRHGSGECFAVVKQNAYGHGLIECAEALAGDRADGFAVSDIGEARILRQIGIEAPIMVMSEYIDTECVAACQQLGLELVLGDSAAVPLLIGARLPRLWIKINTGMNRYGIHPRQTGEIIDTLTNDGITAIGLMTHLACADNMEDSSAERQRELFHECCTNYEYPVSIVNSAGHLRWRQGGDRARCGIAIYGSAPIADLIDLRAVMTVYGRIIGVQNEFVGDRVGYELRDRLEQPCETAVVSIGYAGGYPFPGQRGTPVLINGQQFPIIGRTSMNMIVVDISQSRQQIRSGDEVMLWGKGLPVDLVAKKNATISYQLMCAVSGLKKKYLNR